MGEEHSLHLPSSLLTSHPLPLLSPPSSPPLLFPHPSPFLLPPSLLPFPHPLLAPLPSRAVAPGETSTWFQELSLGLMLVEWRVTLSPFSGVAARVPLPPSLVACKAAPCTAWWSPVQEEQRLSSRTSSEDCWVTGDPDNGEGCLSRGPGPVAPVGA